MLIRDWKLRALSFSQLCLLRLGVKSHVRHIVQLTHYRLRLSQDLLILMLYSTENSILAPWVSKHLLGRDNGSHVCFEIIRINIRAVCSHWVIRCFKWVTVIEHRTSRLQDFLLQWSFIIPNGLLRIFWNVLGLFKHLCSATLSFLLLGQFWRIWSWNFFQNHSLIIVSKVFALNFGERISNFSLKSQRRG